MSRWFDQEARQTWLFIVGVAGFVYLLVWFPPDRDPWPFVVLLAGMLGIPAFIQADRAINGAKPSEPANRKSPNDPQA